MRLKFLIGIFIIVFLLNLPGNSHSQETIIDGRVYYNADVLEFEFGERMEQTEDDVIKIHGIDGLANTDLSINLDGVGPTLYSQTDSVININDDLSITGTLDAGSISQTGNITAGNIQSGADGADGQITIYSEQGVTDYAAIFKPHAAMTQTTTYTLPPDDGTVDYVLQTDGSGNLTWVAVGTGTITAVGDVASGDAFTGTAGNTLTFKGATSGTIALKPTDVAGTNTITMPAETGTVTTSATSLAGDVTGTIGATIVGDDSHAHTGATLSGIDISDDTNLAGDTEIVLTGDALSIAASITRDSELSAHTGDTSDPHGSTQSISVKLQTPEVENSGNITIDAINAAAASTVAIQNSDATYTANLTVDGNVTATGTVGGSNLSGTNTGDQTITLTGDVTGSGTGSFATTVVDDSHAHTTTTISGLDVSDDLNLTAGRSLTLTGDDVAADTELYTDTKCIYWENPVATDDFKSIWIADGYAVTLTRMWGESDQTVVWNFQVDDGTVANVSIDDLTMAAGTVSDTTLDGDTTMASGDRLDLKITSVTDTPTWASVCFTCTKDD